MCIRDRDHNTGKSTVCRLGMVYLSAIPGDTAREIGVPADGRELDATRYANLFALFGGAYGGNGKDTFAVPDLRAATPNGMQYVVCAEGDLPADAK